MKPTAAITALLLLHLLPPLAVAIEPTHHPLVVKDDGATLTQAVDAAMGRAAALPAIDARRAQADAFERLGRHPFASGSTLSLSYIDDSTLSDLGLTEIEGGIEVGLWRPGQRDAMRSLASGLERGRAAYEQWLRWTLSGEVRALLADIRLAELDAERARIGLDNARALQDAVRRQLEAGDVAREALLQVDSLVLEHEARLTDAHAGLVDAERSWVTLTGLQVRPARSIESRAASTETIPPDHPQLALLDAELEVARSRIETTTYDEKGSPTVSFGYRRERGGQLAPWIESVGVGISIPVGGHPSRAASVSAAVREAAAIETERTMRQRSLSLQLHEVEHELEVNERRLKLAAEREAIDRQRWLMAKTGFDAGEFDLTTVLRAFERFNQSARNHLESKADRHRLISLFNQITGAPL